MLTFPAPKAASKGAHPALNQTIKAEDGLSPQTQTILTFTALAAFFVATLAVAAASMFYVLRDDLVNTALVRHAHMQHAYEDRISALRSKVDLVTSRQLLDQRRVEERVEKLLAQQRELKRRAITVDRAYKRSSLTTGSIRASAASTPRHDSFNKSFLQSRTELRLGGLRGASGALNGAFPGLHSEPLQANSTIASIARTGATFDQLESVLKTAADAQIANLETLRDGALTKASRLRRLLEKNGVTTPKSRIKHGIGGPLIEATGGSPFDNAEASLSAALKELKRVRHVARRVPHGNPTPGSQISSRFGTRRDPFTGRKAIHAGLDYRAKRGTPIYATAGGRVARAGRRGGYGKLVEIDHGNGMRTRYAHMNAISVRVGQQVKRGTRIGTVGSTGRSTGPHLHYEVRRNGKAINPIHFVRLSKDLLPLL